VTILSPRSKAALLIAGCLVANTAGAQAYPAKPVRIIEPHPAGSILDNAFRGVAQTLTQALGQPFVIDNRAGAEGIIGAEACAKAPADGYSLCATDALVISLAPVVRAKLPYDPPRDFTPVVHLGALASVVAVNPAVAANNMGELLELARQKPGTITWGSWGTSSLSNIYIEWLKNAKGIRFLNVPYKSALQAYQATLAGETQVAMFGAGSALPFLKAGKVRALAVNGELRSAIVPDLASFKELGIDVYFRPWFGMLAPAATPREIVQRLNAVVGKAVADAQFREKFLLAQGLENIPPAGAPPEQFAAFLKTERALLENVVRVAGIKEE
jgi:tripartite-type tricarboxylate transporter receptor subunit TctC